MRTSAPSRTSSLTNMNRPSNTFSVISAVPVETAARATAIGCRSVGKPGIGQRDDVDAARPPVHRDPDAVGQRPRPCAPASVSLSRATVRWSATARSMTTSPAGHDRADRPGAGDDPVGHGRVGDRRERVDALDGDRRGAGAVDAGAHGDEHRAEVDDLRLAGGVVDDRGALGQHRRHDQVLGGPDRREVQPDRRAGQPGRGGHEEAVLADDRGAQPLQPGDVHVQAAGADGVAAGQRHPGGAAAGDQRARAR